MTQLDLFRARYESVKPVLFWARAVVEDPSVDLLRKLEEALDGFDQEDQRTMDRWARQRAPVDASPPAGIEEVTDESLIARVALEMARRSKGE